jgi:hypothetical protein
MGRKDGFSCLVNYRKLTHKLLETLTYSYLQDWLTAQTAAAKDGKPGADLRLAAAQELQNKLKLILQVNRRTIFLFVGSLSKSNLLAGILT